MNVSASEIVDILSRGITAFHNCSEVSGSTTNRVIRTLQRMLVRCWQSFHLMQQQCVKSCFVPYTPCPNCSAPWRQPSLVCPHGPDLKKEKKTHFKTGACVSSRHVWKVMYVQHDWSSHIDRWSLKDGDGMQTPISEGTVTQLYSSSV